MRRAVFPAEKRRQAQKAASGDDVGEHAAFQNHDLVLERELALLQTLHLKLVERRTFVQSGDHVVEVAMLAAKRGQFFLQHLLFVHTRGARWLSGGDYTRFPAQRQCETTHSSQGYNPVAGM